MRGHQCKLRFIGRATKTAGGNLSCIFEDFNAILLLEKNNNVTAKELNKTLLFLFHSYLGNLVLSTVVKKNKQYLFNGFG